MTPRAILLPVSLLVAACGVAQKVVKGPPHRTLFEQEKIDRAVEEGAVILGMTKSEVRASRGEPRAKDTVERLGGKLRRWLYAWDEVYFDADGLVVGTKASY